ncbi:MAG: DUF4846 domain-containing protein [bacterium]
MRSLLFLMLLLSSTAFAAPPERPWPLPNVETRPLVDVFAVPDGFERVLVPNGSFGAWLRELPIRSDRTHVLAYDGRRLGSPSAGIVALDVGSKDLQQCADTAMRLYAEWRWATSTADALTFHFTSGDPVDWKSWRKGKRWWLENDKVKSGARAGTDNSYASFRRFLDLVFTYAGTRSLPKDSVAVSAAQPGDFFVQSGSPGHVVVVMDVAENEDGKRIALIGQGFMPAQELHILRSSGDRVIEGVWFELPTTDHPDIKTPSWKAFSAGDLRRFK